MSLQAHVDLWQPTSAASSAVSVWISALNVLLPLAMFRPCRRCVLVSRFSAALATWHFAAALVVLVAVLAVLAVIAVRWQLCVLLFG